MKKLMNWVLVTTLLCNNTVFVTSYKEAKTTKDS